jgi:C2 domain of PTEN tumour-suppressor protein
VYYFDYFIQTRRKDPSLGYTLPTTVQKIFKIRMVTIPSFEKGGFIPNFKVICKDHVFYDYKNSENEEKKIDGEQRESRSTFLRSISYHDFFIYESEKNELLVYDDVKIQFYHKDEKKFHFWFNTEFIDSTGQLFLNKEMIDKASGDKKNHFFDKNFSIKVFMTKVDEFKMESIKLERDSKPKKNARESENSISAGETAGKKSYVNVPFRLEKKLHK